MINKILIYIHPRISCNACIFARLNNFTETISSFIAGLSLIIATPMKIYDKVSKTIVLNVYKYFKDEAIKVRPNYPQRSYVKKTPEATGLPQRTISVLDTRGYQKVRALMLLLFNGIRYHTKHLSCVKLICF